MSSSKLTSSDRVRIRETITLSNDYYVLKKTIFDYHRSDGSWQTLSRETYDRGNGAVILLYNKQLKTVVLTRQFRFPAFVNGHDGMLIEACAGLLDERDPETCIKAETEEETGFTIDKVQPVFNVFMSPGSVTERLHFFIAEYDSGTTRSKGGGLLSDGEDIAVIEPTLDEALAMIDTGAIADGKTIMLLQYLRIKGIL